MKLEFQLPQYELTIPSTQEKITVRPFVVREEKLLLIAAETKDTQEVIKTTKQVIKNCILTEGVDIDKLPFFDIDYLYIALRAKSIGDSVEITYTCNNDIDENTKCGTEFPATIDLANVAVISKNLPMSVTITGQTKVLMKFPTYATMKTIEDAPTNIDKKVSLIASCIKTIHVGEKVFTPGKDFTPGELKDFVESMTQQAFKKLEEFIDNLPTFVVTAEAVCPKCKYHHKISYDNFDTFFF